MAESFSISLEGSIEVQRFLQQLDENAPMAMRAALYEEGTELLNDADRLVPRDTGKLAESKFLREDFSSLGFGPITFLAGYGGAAAPYALVVHENPRSGKTGGLSPQGKKYRHWAAVGQWKYLEQPFKERMSGFTGRMADRLRASLLKRQ